MFLEHMMRNQPDAIGSTIVPGRRNGTGHGVLFPDNWPRPSWRVDENNQMIDSLGRPAMSDPTVFGPVPKPPMYQDKPDRNGRFPLNPEWIEWDKKYGKNW